MRPLLLVAATVGVVVAAVGCDDEESSGAGGGGGATSTGAGEGGAPSTTSGQSTGAGEGGAPSTTQSTGGGGEGGAPSTTSTQSTGGGGEGGGPTFCMPGADEACYTGPSGTDGVGLCVAGTHTCNDEGSAYGPCEGEVLPAPETCNTPDDDDCDGMVNEDGDGCVCAPNAVVSCYSGPLGTSGVGVCTAGMAMCNGDGTAQGPCMGEVLPGNESCAATTDLNCDGSVTPTCTGDHIWSKRFTGSSAEIPHDLTTDTAGNILVSGHFSGNINLGGTNLSTLGGSDMFVAKLDPSGNHVWSKRFGGTSGDNPRGLATDATGNVVFGGSYFGSANFGGGTFNAGMSYDGVVVKLDAAGNHVWSKTFPDGDEDYVADVATDPAGNVIAVGSFHEMVDVGGGPFMTPDEDTDAFMVKLDPAGNHLWSKHIYAIQEQSALTVATDSAGSVYVTGRLSSETVDLGGGFIYGGSFVVKYDAAGNHVWSRTVSANVDSYVVDGAGNSYLSGDFIGQVDFGGGPLTSAGGWDVFVAKLDANGNHVWSKRFGSSNDQLGPGLAVDSGNNVVLAGTFYNTINFGGGSLVSAGGERDIFVAKLDTDGNQVWSKRFGDSNGQRGLALAHDPTDNLLVTGEFVGTLTFGGASFTAPASNADMYMAKLAP